MSNLSARLARRAGARPERTPLRERHSLRRIAATLVAVLLGAGLSVVGAAAPASAHHNTITASAVCAADGKTATITWTVTNSEGIEEEITSSSNEGVIAKGTKIAGTSSATGEQPGAKVGTEYKLKLGAKWTNGQTQENTGKFTVPKDLCGGGNGGGDNVCKKLDLKVDVTGDHKSIVVTAPDGKLIAEVCVKAGSANQGNGPETTTYNPPVKSVTISHTSGKDISHYSVRYVDESGHDWEYAAPTCEALTVDYPGNLPAGQAVDVNVRITADGTPVTLNFRNADGSTYSGTKVFTFADHADWPDPHAWTVEWVQVAGTNYHWQGQIECGDDVVPVPAKPAFSDTCGPDNEVLAPLVDTDSVRWERVDAPDSITVTAFAKDGFVFPGGATSYAFPPFAVDDEPCPPKEVAVPVKPAFSDTCGPDNDVLAPLVDTASVRWQRVDAPDSITVTAFAKDGFVFPGGATSYAFPPFAIDDEPCPPKQVEVPVKPAFSDTCGPDNEVLAPLVETTSVRWERVDAPGSITVTAVAKDGFVFPGGATSHAFPPFAIDDEPCPPKQVAVPVKPAFSDTCGPDNEVLAPLVETTSVRWQRVDAPGSITVTAFAKDGFVFPGGATSHTFEPFTVDDQPCPPKVITFGEAPTGSDTCGPDNGVLEIPEVDEDAHYTFEKKGSQAEGRVVVTAVAEQGYAFDKGQQTEWTFDYLNTPCIAIPAEPKPTDLCGVDLDAIVLPEPTAHVTWTIDGDAKTGAATAIATTEAGYTFADGTTTKAFDFTFTATPCIAPSLTGSLATGVCEADVPWIFYDVVLTDPDGQATSRLVTLTLSDGTNSHVIELGELDEDGTLSGQALWPGASVDGEGNPTGWPGWEQTADGTWVETDDNFAWTRNVSSAVLAVNPDLPLTLAYPPATPNCLTGPGGGEGDDGSTPAAAGQGAGLASTGFAGGTIAIVAGIIVLAGAAFLVIAAIRRKKKA
ncbi:hypothetical protein [Agromyces agglutinans]|uniref:hypothetical protein n=1 Tax=Agromyces agglutinans TaxID=2662258 RepID=UPI001C129A9B|nr:hypothetical protein [Agromyces agglutinans]